MLRVTAECTAAVLGGAQSGVVRRAARAAMANRVADALLNDAKQAQRGIVRHTSLNSVTGETHLDAVHALHLCVQLEKDILFFDENFEVPLTVYAREETLRA